MTDAVASARSESAVEMSPGHDHKVKRPAMSPVLLCALGINTGVFALWQFSDRTGNRQLGKTLFGNTVCSAEHIRRFRFQTLLLSACSHRRPLHFGMNAYGLFLFGNVASTVLAPSELGLLLATGALSSSALHCATHPRTQVLGASGVVMGLLTTAALIEPERRFKMVFPVPGMQLSLLQVADLALAVNAAGFLLRSRMPRVAWAAHIGGTTAGLGFAIGGYATGDARFANPWRVHAEQFVSDWERTADSVEQAMDRVGAMFE